MQSVAGGEIGNLQVQAMWSERNSTFNISWLVNIQILSFFIAVYCGGELPETDAFTKFLMVIDPVGSLSISFNGSQPNPCSDHRLGVICDTETRSIREIKLESMKLSGKIDADSLCQLSSLQVLSLANNLITGTIPESISNCRSLSNLNLSKNLLHGKLPDSLSNLKNLQILDISYNKLSGPIPSFTQTLDLFYPKTLESHDFNYVRKIMSARANNSTVAPSPSYSEVAKEKPNHIYFVYYCALVVFVVASLSFGIFVSKRKETKHTAGEENPVKVQDSPVTMVVAQTEEHIKPEESEDEVFFVEEEQRFRLDELLASAADLQGQSLISSLYKASLKDNTALAVKRMRKLHVSDMEFRQTMTQVGNLKHPNILPLIAFRSSAHEKLLVYRYQRNQSLLHLLESYAEGKRGFPWELRLSLARGIAQGLNYIYRKIDPERAPHGNLKLSNILISDNEEALISEYGFHRFIEPKTVLLCSSNGYVAPERKLTEKADVYSFGVILLVLLTGKTVEKSGLDIVKWVKAMVREEWTGEVFDKEVNRVGKQWAFPLLNISLQCVEQSPDKRPTIAELTDQIEEVVNRQDEYSFSSSSLESDLQDGCLLHLVIPEVPETPGSIH